VQQVEGVGGAEYGVFRHLSAAASYVDTSLALAQYGGAEDVLPSASAPATVNANTTTSPGTAYVTEAKRAVETSTSDVVNSDSAASINLDVFAGNSSPIFSTGNEPVCPASNTDASDENRSGRHASEKTSVKRGIAETFCGGQSGNHENNVDQLSFEQKNLIEPPKNKKSKPSGAATKTEGDGKTEWKRKLKPSKKTEDRFEKNWMRRYEELKQNTKENNCDANAVSDIKIRGWVNFQKTEYRNFLDGKRSRMTSAKIRKLIMLGVKLPEKVKYNCVPWEERMKQLAEFKRVHGHLRVPRENPTLGVWVKGTRSSYVNFIKGKKDGSAMSNSRVQQLTALGFVFQAGKSPNRRDPSKTKTWAERLEELMEFKVKFGDCNVPQQFKENTSLACWVKHQRAQYKFMEEGRNTLMTPEKALKLFQVGFVFKLRERRTLLPSVSKVDPCVSKVDPCVSKVESCVSKVESCVSKVEPCASKVEPSS